MGIKRQTLFAELKRRNVLRAAVLYVGAIWAFGQGLSQFSPALGLPDWITRWFLIAACIGFPFWIAFAWIYEFTPTGLKRESEVAPNDSVTRSTARKLDFAIIGVMAIAIVLLASGYFIRRHTTNAVAGKTGMTFVPPKDTLVVLPFRNLSGDPKQRYFSDGITEELTDAIGKNSALRVIAWDTASQYRDSKQSAMEIGRALNVANILHGSIARAGNAVRITTELVDARNGYQLWSHHYDAAFANIFTVQDQVSEAIATALQVRLAQADLPAAGTPDPEAHELVLKGRALTEKADAKSLEAARQDFMKALALDPNYAEAHARLAIVLIGLINNSDLPLKTTLPIARAHARKALALDPHNASAMLALGSADANADPPDYAQARTEFRQAVELNPSSANAHLDYGILLPLKPSIDEMREATLLDPYNAIAWNNLALRAADRGDWTQDVAAIDALIRLDPADVDGAFTLAYAYQQLHQYDKMASAFDRVRPATDLDKLQVAAGRLVYQALHDQALRPQALVALDDLNHHASNQGVAANLMQLYLALGESVPALKLLEGICPANPVGCGDLAVNPMYQALRTDPNFRRLEKKYATLMLE